MCDRTKATTSICFASSLNPYLAPPANKVLSSLTNLQSLLETEWEKHVTRITDTLLANLHLLQELLHKTFLSYVLLKDELTTPGFRRFAFRQRQVASVAQPTGLNVQFFLPL